MSWLSDTWDEVTSGGAAETETYNGSSSSSNKSNNSSSSGGGGSSSGGSSSGGSSSGGGSKNTVPTNQDRINEIYASTDDPWDTYGAELNDLLSAGRSSTYTGATSSGGGNSTVINRGTTSGGSTSSGGGGSTSSGGRTSSGGSSSQTTRKAQVNRNGKKVDVDVLGQVSANGQYAGDGFEWTQNDNTNALSRVYTGAGKGNGLGSAVVQAGSADSTLKETIAGISLNEGSSFAGAKSSATDGSFFDMFKPEGERKSSGSYAEQVGNTNYKPSLGVLESSSSPGSFGDAFADARKSGKDVFDYNGSSFNTQLAPEPRPLDSVRPQIRPDEVFALGDAEAAKIDYTPDYGSMGFGERGRGGPGGPGALQYPGNPLQALVDLRDTVPSALSAGERLQANQFENSNNYNEYFNYDPSGSYDVAQAGPGFPGGGGGSTLTPASSLVDMLTNPRLGYEAGQDFVTSLQDIAPSLRPLREGISDEFYGRTSEPRVNVQETMAAADAKVPTSAESMLKIASEIIPGITEGISDAARGAEVFAQEVQDQGFWKGSMPTGSGVLPAIANYAAGQFLTPQAELDQRILERPENIETPSSNVMGTISEGFSDATALIDRLLGTGDISQLETTNPTGTLREQTEGLFIDGTPEQFGGQIAREAGDVFLDMGLATLGPVGMAGGAVKNAAEQLAGQEPAIQNKIGELYKSGALDNNEVYKQALESTISTEFPVGNPELALKNISSIAFNRNPGKVASTGALDMAASLIPAGYAARLGLAGATETGQGAAENALAIEAINSVLGTKIPLTEDIVAAALNEGAAGLGSATVAAGVNTLQNAVSSRQNKEMTEAVDASDAAMGNLPGPAASLVSAGELSLAPAPAPVPAPSTSPATGTAPGTLAPAVPTSGQAPVQVATPRGIETVAPDQIAYDPTISTSSGKLANSTVKSSFSPPTPTPATSIDAMAAQEILNELAREASFSGEQVSPEILDNIMEATNLDMNDIGSMMEQAYNEASADTATQSNMRTPKSAGAAAGSSGVTDAILRKNPEYLPFGYDFNLRGDLETTLQDIAFEQGEANRAAGNPELGATDADAGVVPKTKEDLSRFLIEDLGKFRPYGSTVPTAMDTPQRQLKRQQDNIERAENNRAKTQAEAEAVAGMEAADLSLPVDPGGVASLQNFDTQGIPLVDSPAAQADRRRTIANRLKGEAEAAAMAPLNTAQDALDAVVDPVPAAIKSVEAQRAEMLEANKTYQDYIQTKARLDAVNAAIKDGAGQFGPNGTGDPNPKQVDFEQAIANNQFGDADSLVVDSPPTIIDPNLEQVDFEQANANNQFGDAGSLAVDSPLTIIRDGAAPPASDAQNPVVDPEMSFDEVVSIINAEGSPNIIRDGEALPPSDVETPVENPEMSFEEAVTIIDAEGSAVPEAEVDAEGNTVIEVAQVPAIVPTTVPQAGIKTNPSSEILEGDILYEMGPYKNAEEEKAEGVTIDVDGTFDGEILNPEISTDVNGTNPDGSVTIDLDAQTDPSTPAISPPPQNTDPSTEPTTNTTARPLIEVEVDGDEEEEEGVEVEVPNSPFVFELGGDDDPRRKVPKAGVAPAMEECPDGYVQVRGPDGRLMCQKTFTQNRQRAGASTQAYTGINSGKQRGSGQTRKEYEVVQEILSPNEKETLVEVDAKSLLGML